MKGTVLYGPRDVRFEEIETPKITKPTDAITSREGCWLASRSERTGDIRLLPSSGKTT